jgi:RNase P protein component
MRNRRTKARIVDPISRFHPIGNAVRRNRFRRASLVDCSGQYAGTFLRFYEWGNRIFEAVVKRSDAVEARFAAPRHTPWCRVDYHASSTSCAVVLKAEFAPTPRCGIAAAKN